MRVTSWAFTWVLAGCTADVPGPGPTGPPPGTDTGEACEQAYGGPGPATTIPEGRIEVRAMTQVRWLLATATDVPHPHPSSIRIRETGRPMEEAERDDPCRLLRWLTAVPCDPPCPVDETCWGGACIPTPQVVSLGTLTVTGLSSAPFTIEQGTYWYGWEEHGAFDAERVEVTAAGGVATGLELRACVPAPLVPAGDWDALFRERARAQPVTLTWEDPVETARVQLWLAPEAHGSQDLGIWIECDGPDTGELQLPGPWLDEVFAVSGYAPLTVARVQVDEAVSEIRVRLEVRGGEAYLPAVGSKYAP